MDRGAWGLEVLILLAAWKLAMPQYVTLLRGNHESTTCTRLYGFHAEMQVRDVRQRGSLHGPRSLDSRSAGSRRIRRCPAVSEMALWLCCAVLAARA